MVDPKYNNFFNPSITSQQGLNMVKLEDIRSLAKKEEPDFQLIAIYKYVCHFLNEYIEHIEEDNIISHFINNVFPRYKVDSISKSSFFNMIESLFLKIIVKIKFSYQQCWKVDEFNTFHFDLLNPPAILRLHKSTSYMVYIVKDLADFITKKTSNGTFYVSIQYATNDNVSLNKRVNALTKYI